MNSFYCFGRSLARLQCRVAGTSQTEATVRDHRPIPLDKIIRGLSYVLVNSRAVQRSL
jgi:hypothetical protein